MVVGLLRARVVYPPVYVVAGTAMWLCAYEAGIHPTLAGVVMGLLAPATPFPHEPVTERLTKALHPWTSYLIVPLFALANAGIGFTVSWFVAGLAFDDVSLEDDAKIGILVASVLAAALGSAVLVAADRPHARRAHS